VSSGRITDASLELVKDRVDMIELVRARTELQRSGGQWRGRCPFHDERTPSFWVDPAKKLYHCHGCGVGGDAITFVRESYALDFKEAVEWLAERFGVELQYQEVSREEGERRARSDRLYSLLATAADFYARFLLESPQAAGARAYVEQRRLGDDVVRAYALGFAPDAWDHVTRAARGRGFSDDELVATGLSLRRSGGGLVDRLRGRLMFPLADGRGRVVAFGGRRLPDELGLQHVNSPDAKYVNSPDGPLWHKGDVLYGLHLAKRAIAQHDLAIVVEGYTDVLALHQAGIGNVVASMGTALTERHLRELRKLSRNVVLFFDADAAGAEAAQRGIERAESREFGFSIRIAALPTGRDPGDLAGEGSQALDAAIAGARSVVAFRVHRLLDAADLTTTAGRDAAWPGLRDVLSGAGPGPERNELIREVVGRLRLSPIEEQQLHRSGLRRGVLQPSAEPARTRDVAFRDERLVLAFCLAGDVDGAAVLERLGEEAFQEPIHREAREWLLRRLRGCSLREGDQQIAADLEPELRALAAREAASPAAVEEKIKAIEARSIDARVETLKRKAADDELSREEALELARLVKLAQQAREASTRAHSH
jgi:DNA primase